MVGFLGGTRGSSLGFPPPGGGRGGAFSVRGGVNPTAKNLVASKRRRIRTRDPKSPGKPQQSRGAEVLFQGIFPLARIRARSRGQPLRILMNLEKEYRPRKNYLFFENLLEVLSICVLIANSY